MSRIIHALRGCTIASVAACAALLPSTSSAATLGTYDHLLAPTTTCVNQTSSTVSAAAQRTAMHCLVSYARSRTGLKPLTRSSLLDTSAQRKAEDIVRCGQFSHTACGRSFDYFIKQVGWRGARWGENIAWGSDSGGRSTPRATMRSWLHSDGHRANMLKSSFDQLGVGLVQAPFKGYRSGIWVQHLGGSR